MKLANLVWDEETTNKLIELYDKGVKDHHTLAQILGRKYRSVVYKLSDLGLLEKPIQKEAPKKITIPVLFKEIESLLNIKLEGTTLYNKHNLEQIVQSIRNIKNGQN